MNATRPQALRTCWCGQSYVAGADDRQRHQTLWGHRPEPARPKREPDATGLLTTDCRLGHHQLCDLDGQPGGVIVSPGVTAECGCVCHRPGTQQMSSRCRRAAHTQCNGTTLFAGRREACLCGCHHQTTEAA